VTPLVVDANVVLKWYFHEPFSEDALRLLGNDYEIVVPDIVHSQIGTVLWKRMKSGELKREDALRIVSNVRRLPLVSVPTAQLAPAALEIATVTARTYTESVYFALAMRYKTPLVTGDRRWYTLLSTGPMRPFLRWVGDVK